MTGVRRGGEIGISWPAGGRWAEAIRPFPTFRARPASVTHLSLLLEAARITREGQLELDDRYEQSDCLLDLEVVLVGGVGLDFGAVE